MQIMRVLKEIMHPACKITLYAWNNRYIIKFEQGLLEQTYKVNEFDIIVEDDIEKMLDQVFIQAVLERFEGMSQSLAEAIHRI